MKNIWQRFLDLLTPGVRTLLLLLTAVYSAAIAGKLTGAFDLYAWLVLTAPGFWSGQGWRLISYSLLPAGILDFLMNGFALIFLGGLLERHWTRRQLWLYCAVAAAGAGLAKVLLPFSSPEPLIGATPMLFGLLVAWGFLCGRETVTLLPLGEMSVRKLVLVAGAVSFLAILFTAGIFAAVIVCAGGAVGWLYLWLKQKWLMSRAASVAQSERMHRLEL